jgi:hypothetical protein
MKRKNQLIQEPSAKKVKINMTSQSSPFSDALGSSSKKTKRCSDEYNYDYSLGGASDEDECEYDRKKRLKINNGVIYTLQRTITKNKNNIPSYIN